jgi:hypothetical protein
VPLRRRQRPSPIPAPLCPRTIKHFHFLSALAPLPRPLSLAARPLCAAASAMHPQFCPLFFQNPLHKTTRSGVLLPCQGGPSAAPTPDRNHPNLAGCPCRRETHTPPPYARVPRFFCCVGRWPCSCGGHSAAAPPSLLPAVICLLVAATQVFFPIAIDGSWPRFFPVRGSLGPVLPSLRNFLEAASCRQLHFFRSRADSTCWHEFPSLLLQPEGRWLNGWCNKRRIQKGSVVELVLCCA